MRPAEDRADRRAGEEQRADDESRGRRGSARRAPRSLPSAASEERRRESRRGRAERRSAVRTTRTARPGGRAGSRRARCARPSARRRRRARSARGTRPRRAARPARRRSARRRSRRPSRRRGRSARKSPAATRPRPQSSEDGGRAGASTCACARLTRDGTRGRRLRFFLRARAPPSDRSDSSAPSVVRATPVGSRSRAVERVTSQRGELTRESPRACARAGSRAGRTGRPRATSGPAPAASARVAQALERAHEHGELEVRLRDAVRGGVHARAREHRLPVEQLGARRLRVPRAAFRVRRLELEQVARRAAPPGR